MEAFQDFLTRHKLMEALGHSDGQQSQRYVNYAQADIERAQRRYSPMDRLRRGR